MVCDSQGGELFTFMRKRRRALRESWARFYVAAVVMGFGYLSARDIVYRCSLSHLGPAASMQACPVFPPTASQAFPQRLIMTWTMLRCACLYVHCRCLCIVWICHKARPFRLSLSGY